MNEETINHRKRKGFSRGEKSCRQLKAGYFANGLGWGKGGSAYEGEIGQQFCSCTAKITNTGDLL